MEQQTQVCKQQNQICKECAICGKQQCNHHEITIQHALSIYLALLKSSRNLTDFNLVKMLMLYGVYHPCYLKDSSHVSSSKKKLCPNPGHGFFKFRGICTSHHIQEYNESKDPYKKFEFMIIIYDCHLCDCLYSSLLDCNNYSDVLKHHEDKKKCYCNEYLLPTHLQGQLNLPCSWYEPDMPKNIPTAVYLTIKGKRNTCPAHKAGGILYCED